MQLPKGKKYRWVAKLSPLSLLVCSQFATAEGLDISGSLETTALLQNRHSDLGKQDLTTYSVTPEIAAAYETRTFRGSVVGSATHLDRDYDDNAREDTFGEYSYDLNWAAIENLLSFEVAGAQRYMDGSGNNYVISDYYLNSETLVKTQTSRYASYFTLPEGDYLAANASVTYTNTETEDNEFLAFDALDTASLFAETTLRNGDSNKRFFWEVAANHRELERDESMQGDYESEFATGKIDGMVSEFWAVRLTASYDANELTDRNDEFSNDREFKSYGAGITFRKSDQRYISLTANTVDSDIDRDDGDTFIGIDTRWSITPRTSIQGQYGRRFYGKSGNASINYNTRHVRAMVMYREEVTSFARLAASPRELGLFVCPLVNFSIDACFQPSSLDYQPSADEILLQIDTGGLELSNSIILRKSSLATLGLSGRRLNVSFDAQYASDDFLEVDRQRRSYNLGATASYRLSRRTDVTSSLRYGRIEQTSVNTPTGESEQWDAKIGLSRDFGRSLSADVDLGYLNRTGSINAQLYGDEFSERRISFTLRYDFE